ncbi:MAG: LptF/LptG family permease [Mariprofundaceae bacterium]
MPILFRWLFRGAMARAMAAMFALLAVYAIIESFDKARYLGDGLTPALMIEYIVLRIPFMISEFMPVIVLIAASLFLAELMRHREIVAMRAAGLGVNKLLAPLLAMGLLAAAASLAIGEWVTPVTNQRLDVIQNVHIRHHAHARHDVQWLRDGTRFFRLAPVGRDVFSVIVLETDGQGGWLRRIDGARGRWIDGTWHLEDVHISQPGESGMDLVHVQRLDVPSGVGPQTADPPLPRHMNFMQLARYIDELERAGLNATGYIHALHRKLAAPLACLLMTVLAVALCAYATGRGGGSWSLVGAIALGLLFYVTGNASGLLAAGERLPAAWAAWLPDAVFGGLAVFLLLKREGY